MKSLWIYKVKSNLKLDKESNVEPDKGILLSLQLINIKDSNYEHRKRIWSITLHWRKICV